MPFILHRSRDNIILHARLRYTDAADADRTPEGHLNRRKFVADSVATFAAGSSFLPLTFSDAPSTEGVMGSSRTFTLDAKPTSITLDTAKTAIVVVDMQDDFGTKGGMFDRAGIDISLIQRAVPPTARVLAANDFMYWEVMRRASERGYRVFDFGRSKVGTGSYAFKCNWGFQPTPLVYQFRLAPGRSVPDLNPLNPKLAIFVAAWKRLPLGVATLLGPSIVRGLG